MHFHHDELIGSLEEFCSQHYDARGTITNLLVLQLTQLHNDLSCWVLDLQLAEDGGAIVCDGHVTDVVDEHLVEALGTE
jgi:hypothetical protein